MEFADYLSLLRRRAWLILVALVICLAAAAATSWHATPKFRAGTRLLVSSATSDSTVDEITKRQLASQRALAYSQYATTRPAIQAAVQAAGVQSFPSVSAAADGKSPFIVITVSSTNAAAAAAVANAYALTLPKSILQLDNDPQGTLAPKLSVVESAGVPGTPYSPDHKRDLLVGLVLGLVLGVAAAFVRETLDATVRHSSDVERLTDAELLGIVVKEYGEERLIAVTRPRSRRTEAYRQVRTNLEFTSPDGAPRSLVVTSSGPGEGKTTLACNLAVIASHAGKNVVLVDADLRRPTVAQVMQVPGDVGLSEVLAGRVSLPDAILQMEGERLSVLPSGKPPSAPSEYLGSTAMLDVIRWLEDRYDLVIIDSAPVLPVTDALVIGVNTGGMIVVTRLAQTTRTALKRTVAVVRNVNATLLGVVANGAVEKEDRRYGYGYGYLSERVASSLDELKPAGRIRAAGRREDEADPYFYEDEDSTPSTPVVPASGLEPGGATGRGDGAPRLARPVKSVPQPMEEPAADHEKPSRLFKRG